MSKKQELVITPPRKDSSGYPLRMRKAAELQERLNEGLTVKLVDEIIAYLLNYVEKPENRKQAEELLWNVSEDEFDAILSSVTGRASGDTSPLAGTS